MKKTTVQDTVTEYLEQFNRRGFLYVPSQSWDSRKIKAMQKKAIEILSFQDNPGVLAESVRTRGEADSIRDSIRDTISKMLRKSNEEYLIANDYFAFLHQKYKLQIQPFDRQLTSLERQLSIAKDMHDFNKARDFDRQEVAEKYLVSEKTIENDMKALREGISLAVRRQRTKRRIMSGASWRAAVPAGGCRTAFSGALMSWRQCRPIRGCCSITSRPI